MVGVLMRSISDESHQKKVLYVQNSSTKGRISILPFLPPLLPQGSESGDRCNWHHEGQPQQGAGQGGEAGRSRGEVR